MAQLQVTAQVMVMVLICQRMGRSLVVGAAMRQRQQGHLDLPRGVLSVLETGWECWAVTAIASAKA